MLTATNPHGRAIPTIDDWGDDSADLWAVLNEYGIHSIVRAQTYEDAYEAWADEQPTVPVAELPEAFGFDTEAEYLAAVGRAAAAEGEWPKLTEGYAYQGNASGSGVVWVGYGTRLVTVDPERLLNDWQITLLDTPDE